MASQTSFDPARLLREVFGHGSWRPGQEEAVVAACDGRDVLVVMPTGSGKSLCYQLPALGAHRLTLVVSPLVALMQDQVDALRRLGRNDVVALSSATSADDARTTLAAIREGTLKLVYIAPERFANARFAAALAEATVDLLVVDEAHCLSEWGHDFRPDYGRLAAVRHGLGDPPTMALTATATPRVAADIVRRLALRDPVEVRTGFDRPNLTFDVVHASGERGRAELLASGLADPSLRPAIVYCRSRRAVDQVASELGALAYHAGMASDERRRVQETFMASPDAVIVCTNAFGMGVDKADVRSVWHWNLPNSLEAYYQEAGRAGRDGAPARCVLLYSPADRGIIGRFIREARFTADEVDRLLAALARTADPQTGAFRAQPSELALQGSGDESELRTWLAAAEAVGALELAPGAGTVWQGNLRLRRLGVDRRGAVEHRARAIERLRWDQLDAMQGYADRDTCRRETLLRYFGDTRTPQPVVRCCDVHEPPAGQSRQSAGVDPRELVEVLCEIAETAEPSVGRAGLDGITRGLDAYRDRYGEHPRFGCAARMRPPQVRAAIGAAIAGGRLRSTEGRYPLLLPPGQLPRRSIAGSGLPGRARRVPSVAAPRPEDDALVAALKSWRRGEASARGMPAYVVANDRALVEIANRRPSSTPDLLECSGVGRTFVERYGDAVLALISSQE